MRGYFITNMYLSPIQCGIQAAHCIHDMFVSYVVDHSPAREAADNLKQWASDHKTMIVLNGGASSDLESLYTTIDFAAKQHKANEAPFPYGTFREEGLEGALTCVGVILPSHYVDCVSQLRLDPMGPIQHWFQPMRAELLFLQKLARLPLA